MMTVIDATDVPVRKTITVNVSTERAFKVFTEGFDTWWPRSHHIGKGALEKAVIETRLGGRCYGREAGGTECPWGTVLVWEPPHRFVIAWQRDDIHQALALSLKVGVVSTLTAMLLGTLAAAWRSVSKPPRL